METVKKVVWTNGCFDLLHPGHIYILQESRKLGDILIVGLNTDRSIKKLKGHGRPVESYAVRMQKLLDTGLVDKIVAIDISPLDAIFACRPDIITKGDDYKPEDVIGYGLAEVRIIKRLPGVSTTDIVSAHQT